MSSRHSSWDEAAASSVLGLACVLALVVLVCVVWLVVRAVELLVRAVSAHPTNKVLLGTLVACGVLMVAVGVTAGQDEPIDVLAGASVLALLAVAGVLTIADDTRVRRPLSRETAVHAVLHEWWPAA